MAVDYSEFRVLIDDAASAPELGFAEYASALADIICTSQPEFAIGIFGSWGTGKTTLMRQIEARLARDPAVVTAWFTAWRYEREPHLIIPLIDVLRQALDERAAAAAGSVAEGPARRAARALRKAGRAFMAGLSLTGTVAGVGVSLDAGAVMEQITAEEETGAEALSFYHAAFSLLRDAIQTFSEHGTRRVVIFVDDLDRCFPSNALDVLESMKLFFDVQGCVFVVGLDQSVAERAVLAKYALPSDSHGPEHAPVSGVDYLKKIFQVPFALPRVGTDQLDEYCRSMMASAELSPAQLHDFDVHVLPHLGYLADQDTVNPREMKRLINAYVLQIKMLHGRLGDRLDPHVVLALQVMNFRLDWRPFYEELAADVAMFQESLAAAISVGPQERVWLAAGSRPVPPQLAQYLDTLARPLLHNREIGSYVSAAESSRSSDPMLLEAQATLNRVRTALETASLESGTYPHDVTEQVFRLTELCHRRSDQPRLTSAATELEVLMKGPPGPGAEDVARHRQRLTDVLASVEAELRELRRHSNLGAFSSA